MLQQNAKLGSRAVDMSLFLLLGEGESRVKTQEQAQAQRAGRRRSGLGSGHQQAPAQLTLADVVSTLESRAAAMSDVALALSRRQALNFHHLGSGWNLQRGLLLTSPYANLVATCEHPFALLDVYVKLATLRMETRQPQSHCTYASWECIIRIVPTVLIAVVLQMRRACYGLFHSSVFSLGLAEHLSMSVRVPHRSSSASHERHPVGVLV